MKPRALPTLAVLMLAAGGCDTWLGSSEEPPLPGERIPVLTFEDRLEADPRIADLAVRLPRPTVNAGWPQAGGVPNHAMHHLAAGGGLKALWETDIGAGSSSDAVLLAEPVVGGGRLFAMDVEASVGAYDAETGKEVWNTALENEEDDDGTLGGGLAYEGGRVYATTGFAEVFALDAATGKIVWRRRLANPMRSAPTVRNGRVFVLSIANELIALNAADGSTLWSHSGLSEVAGLVGGASPAVDAGIVIAPFTSGEVVALRVENGRVVWSDTLTALRRTDPITSLAHVRGRPVIDRGRVFVVGNSGRTVAIDLRTGNRLWEQSIGGVHGPWVAGEFVYVVSNNAEVVCLSRRDGRVRWIRQLQKFEDEEDREDPIRWAGPVLAGDRLLVAGTNGEVWAVSPYTGKLLGKIEVSGPVLIAPSVANQTVYLLTDDADLIALR
jgi:outer membrane protein assembly factor BamB